MKKIVEAKYTSLRFDEQVMTAKDMGLECFPAKVSAIHR
jgi:ethanolaminephosphotransferase